MSHTQPSSYFGSKVLTHKYQSSCQVHLVHRPHAVKIYRRQINCSPRDMFSFYKLDQRNKRYSMISITPNHDQQTRKSCFQLSITRISCVSKLRTNKPYSIDQMNSASMIKNTLYTNITAPFVCIVSNMIYNQLDTYFYQAIDFLYQANESLYEAYLLIRLSIQPMKRHFPAGFKIMIGVTFTLLLQ